MFTTFFTLLLAVNIGPLTTDGPARAPQMASDGSMVALTFGAEKKIYISVSHDAGSTFSIPVAVAQAEVIPLSRHRGPRIVAFGRTIIISAVAGKALSQGPHAHGLPSDGDLLVWRSVDSGKSWSKGIVVNDVAGAATEGLHSLAGDEKGNLFAAWLDKRSAKGTTLFGARSTDGGLTWSKNILIYDSPEGSICQCCHPSVAIDSSGEVMVMWRNWLKGARDMYLTRSRNGQTFSKPEKLGLGSWQLNACPMDGGGLTAFKGRITTAWRRDHAIFLATPGKNEVAIGEGVDVALASNASGDYAVWATPAGIKALLPGKQLPLALSDHGAFPAVTALQDGRVLAAWENDGKIVVRPLP